MSTRFLLVRHAESTWNAAHRWQGHADPPLSQRGVEQARALAQRLAGERIDVLVSSDLARARRTAEILGEPLGMAPLLEPRLRELDIGRWAGQTRASIVASDAEALARFVSGDPAAPAGGAESRQDLALRVGEAFVELAAVYAGRSVAVVTHRGVVRSLVAGAAIGNADVVDVSTSDLVLPALHRSRADG